jgi:uncharacterized protein
MKLQPDRIHGQTVTGHGNGWLGLDGERFHQNMLIAWNGLRQEWKGTLDSLSSSADFTDLLTVQPEVLLIGCGKQKIVIPMNHLIPFFQQNIGVESMDTAAACRTYNILAAENRKVAAILFV